MIDFAHARATSTKLQKLAAKVLTPDAATREFCESYAWACRAHRTNEFRADIAESYIRTQIAQGEYLIEHSERDFGYLLRSNVALAHTAGEIMGFVESIEHDAEDERREG